MALTKLIFVKLQETGMVGDLVAEGKIYQNMELVFFVPCVKCDTKEADTLCGKYLCRNKYVKMVCRY